MNRWEPFVQEPRFVMSESKFWSSCTIELCSCFVYFAHVFPLSYKRFARDLRSLCAFVSPSLHCSFEIFAFSIPALISNVWMFQAAVSKRRKWPRKNRNSWLYVLNLQLISVTNLSGAIKLVISRHQWQNSSWPVDSLSFVRADSQRAAHMFTHNMWVVRRLALLLWVGSHFSWESALDGAETFADTPAFFATSTSWCFQK